MKKKERWVSVKERKPRSNASVELKAVITFTAVYQPYSSKQEWRALGGNLEEMTLLAWKEIIEDEKKG